jgi:hypothetical protein
MQCLGSCSQKADRIHAAGISYNLFAFVRIMQWSRMQVKFAEMVEMDETGATATAWVRRF